MTKQGDILLLKISLFSPLLICNLKRLPWTWHTSWYHSFLYLLFSLFCLTSYYFLKYRLFESTFYSLYPLIEVDLFLLFHPVHIDNYLSVCLFTVIFLHQHHLPPFHHSVLHSFFSYFTSSLTHPSRIPFHFSILFQIVGVTLYIFYALINSHQAPFSHILFVTVLYPTDFTYFTSFLLLLFFFTSIILQIIAVSVYTVCFIVTPSCHVFRAVAAASNTLIIIL